MQKHSPSPPAVVVGIDGSRSAVDAALWAVPEAVSRDIPLRLLYAIDPACSGADRRDPPRDLAAAEIAVRQAFMAVESTDEPVKIEVEILQDRPIQALLETSKWGAMLCVGAMGFKHCAQGRIGSTAAALASSAHSPVAVVRGHDPLRAKQQWVVAEVDESAVSDGVLRRALEEAQLRGAPLRVLTTWQSRFTDIHDGNAVANGNRLARAQLDRRLAQWKKGYPDLDVRAVAVPGNTLNFLTKNADSIQLLVVGHESGPRRHRARRSSRLRSATKRGLFCVDLRTAERIVSGTSTVSATSTEGLRVVKVFLVDDHEVVRRGLIDLLSADAELDVVGEAGSVAQALARIPALQPDVAVLDVRLPDGNGIELCRELLSRLPNLRCLMLTSFTSDEAMLDAILAGASGYVVKDIKGMELAQAIKEVGAGRSLLDNRAAAALMAKLRGAAEHSDPLSGLSDQERILLDLLGEGLTNKQIAARMFLAEKTVKNYVSRLLAKLGMERRTQAAVFISKLDQSHHQPDE